MTQTSLLERAPASPGDLPILTLQPDLKRAGEQVADWVGAANANADHADDKHPVRALLTAGNGFKPPIDKITAQMGPDGPPNIERFTDAEAAKHGDNTNREFGRIVMKDLGDVADEGAAIVDNPERKELKKYD